MAQAAQLIPITGISFFIVVIGGNSKLQNPNSKLQTPNSIPIAIGAKTKLQTPKAKIQKWTIKRILEITNYQ